MTPRLAIDPDDYLLLEQTAAEVTLFWQGVALSLIEHDLRATFIQATTPEEEQQNKTTALEIFKTVQRGKHTAPGDREAVEHLQAESHLYHMRLTDCFTRIALRVTRPDILQGCVPASLQNARTGFLLQKYKLDALFQLSAPKIVG